MHYQITEAEFIRLQSCERQLCLITDLCSIAIGNTGLGSKEISLEGLMEFVCAQEEVLGKTLGAVEKRAVSDDTPSIRADFLVRIMQACSGEDLGADALTALAQELHDATEQSGDLQALAGFYKALQHQGYNVATDGRGRLTVSRQAPQPRAKAPARKRERLTAGAV